MATDVVSTEDRTPRGGVAATPTSDPLIPRIGRVRSRRHEIRDVWTLDIRDETRQGAGFRSGQFQMVTVLGVGEIPISLSGDPRHPERLIHTIRAVGPVSTALTKMRPGDVVGLRGPFGTGWPANEALGRDVLIIAGGLGLAPLRPLVYELRAERKRFGRIVLLYGARSPDDVLFRRDLKAALETSDIDTHITVDHSTSGWIGNVGVVTTLIPKVGFDPRRTAAFVCGPEVMMRLTISALRAGGLADELIYLSMERNMKCAVALCGRCQFSSVLVCRDGPVFPYHRVRELLKHKEL